MKTTCKTVPPKTKTVRLFADDFMTSEIGTIELPHYEELPKAIVFNDTIYVTNKQYSWSQDQFHAVELVHVAQASEFTPKEPVPEQDDEPPAVAPSAEATAAVASRPDLDNDIPI